MQTLRVGAGWLQLEEDQRRSRDRVAPSDPRKSRELGIRQREERNRLRAIEQRQAWERAAEIRRQQRPGTGVAPRTGVSPRTPGGAARLRGLEMRQEREIQRERLRRDIQQDMGLDPAPRPPAPIRQPTPFDLSPFPLTR